MLDRRFFDVNFVVLGIANEPAENPEVGDQYIVGSEPTGVFAEASANSLARYNGTAWDFTEPREGGFEVLNVATNEILRYGGSDWGVIAIFDGGSDLDVEIHAITAADISSQGFTLSHSVATGYENKVLAFLQGIAQVPGVDFTVTGNSFSWQNKTLANFDFRAGDVLIIQYKRV